MISIFNFIRTKMVNFYIFNQHKLHSSSSTYINVNDKLSYEILMVDILHFSKAFC